MALSGLSGLSGLSISGDGGTVLPPSGPEALLDEQDNELLDENGAALLPEEA